MDMIGTRVNKRTLKFLQMLLKFSASKGRKMARNSEEWKNGARRKEKEEEDVKEDA